MFLGWCSLSKKKKQLDMTEKDIENYVALFFRLQLAHAFFGMFNIAPIYSNDKPEAG